MSEAEKKNPHLPYHERWKWVAAHCASLSKLYEDGEKENSDAKRKLFERQLAFLPGKFKVVWQDSIYKASDGKNIYERLKSSLTGALKSQIPILLTEVIKHLLQLPYSQEKIIAADIGKITLSTDDKINRTLKNLASLGDHQYGDYIAALSDEIKKAFTDSEKKPKAKTLDERLKKAFTNMQDRCDSEAYNDFLTHIINQLLRDTGIEQMTKVQHFIVRTIAKIERRDGAVLEIDDDYAYGVLFKKTLNGKNDFIIVRGGPVLKVGIKCTDEQDTRKIENSLNDQLKRFYEEYEEDGAYILEVGVEEEKQHLERHDSSYQWYKVVPLTPDLFYAEKRRRLDT